MTAAMLQTEGIAKSYKGRRILVAADMTLRAGQIAGLVGRMGTGKSTLLRICSGLSRPDQGTIYWKEALIAKPDYPTLALQGLYFLPANGASIPRRTLRQHLSDLARRYPTCDITTPVHALQLESLLDARMNALSGGERKRAEIAIAIARQPAVLLADEPFRDIDPITRETIASALRQIAATGCAVLVTGHEIDAIFECANSIIWLIAGRTHELGAPADAKQHDRFRNEYLGATPS